jgi:xanthine dehydrogenase accessory factor
MRDLELARFDTRGGLPGLLDALAALHARGESGVLGLVLVTEGSTYQKRGALVLLGPAGMIHGAISGGCLEPELEDRARAVHAGRRAQTIEFDTRSDEDLIFGSGTGCRGRIQLLLLPQGPGAPLIHALNQLCAEGGVLELALSVEGPEVGMGHASLGANTWSWGTDGQHSPRSTSTAPSSNTVLHLFAPPRLLLLGAGPETQPLSRFVRQIGWHLQVVEHRGRWLKFAQAAGVQEIIGLPPDEAAPVWGRRPIDAVIAMTHNYALDMQHLAVCATTEVSYIGLLGPAARRDTMLAELGPQTAARLQGRLHSPVGLALGGSGPEVLALAVAAELQQHFARREKLR